VCLIECLDKIHSLGQQQYILTIHRAYFSGKLARLSVVLVARLAPARLGAGPHEALAHFHSVKQTTRRTVPTDGPKLGTQLLGTELRLSGMDEHQKQTQAGQQQASSSPAKRRHLFLVANCLLNVRTGQILG